MQRIPHQVFLAGALAGIVHVLILQGVLLGVLVFLVPVFLLFVTGMRYGASALSIAMLVSCVVVGVSSDVQSSLAYVMMTALPAWVFGRQLMKIRLLPSGGIEWFPVGGAFVAYTLYCVVLLVLVGGYASQNIENGMLAALQQDIQVTSKTMDADIQQVVQMFVQRFPYLILSLFVWTWGMLMYGAAIFANYVCAAYKWSLRTQVVITPFLPPHWWLGVLLASGALAMSASADVSFLGMTAFIMLLFPYFLCGVSLIHRDIRKTTQPKLWFWLFYFVMTIGQWPSVFIVTMYGLIHHLLFVSRLKSRE